MNPQDLMKPRYKVIADYPGNKMKVGGIIELMPYGSFVGDAFHSKDGSKIWFDKYEIDDFKNYPAVIRLLSWWEERKAEDMPEYIRLNQIQVVKVGKHHSQRHDEFYASDTKYNYAYGICKPATESEYLQSKEAIKQIK